MKLRNKLSYIALGGLLMLIGMLASSAFMPSLFAQRDKLGDIEGMLASPGTAQRDKFGDIECTSLTVVDGGYVSVWGKDGTLPKVALGVDENGGRVYVWGKDGIRPKVFLDVHDDGGLVLVRGKDRKAAASLAATEHGGRVSVYDKDDKPAASLAFTEHGGRVEVSGKGEGKAIMAINEYGNGAVSTWDKNGYRQ